MKEKHSHKLNPYERLEEIVSYITAYQDIVRNEDDPDKISPAHLEISKQFDRASLLKLIITKVEPYIRNYPQIAFRKTNEDLKSDFFVYIYERFENILDKYDHNLGKFSTYLSIKLKNYFLNYVRRVKMMNKIKLINYEITPSTENIFKDRYNLELNVAEREEYIGEKKKETSLLINLKKDPFRYLCIKLYFFELFTKNDFIMLVNYLGVAQADYPSVHKDISELSEEVHRKKLVKIYYENCLNKTYYQNMVREEEIRDIVTVDKHKDTLSEIMAKQKRINDRRGVLLQKYYTINIFPSMKAIAKVLRTEATKVSNIINYYKQYLSKKDIKE
ncbi:hypothetical protein COTS27_00875 [Spirochaetota bacterium]|nr:hypothetical protein COTS27_00875 [Spirochaetota bacterium]